MSFFNKHKNDILLILTLLIVGAAVWAYTFFSRTEGGEVVVTVSGEEVLRLPLSEDCSRLIGENGRENLLIIENGEAFVKDASCPDHVCVRTGAIRYSGQVIVCLPNELTVSIEGGEEPQSDAVSQ